MTWDGLQTKKSYPDFVGLFDSLTDNDVCWTPYTPNVIASHGLSSLCRRDSGYWMTRKVLVWDISVEDYAVRRVMRQFGLYQESPLPRAPTVSSKVHE